MEQVVLRLTKPVSGVWRTVYMDNYFTSVCTFKKMMAFKTWACGTVRAGRGLPADLEKAVMKEKASGKNATMVAGDYFWKHGDDYFLAAAWMDSGPCVGLSTRHDGHEAAVLRRMKGELGRVDRSCMDIFSDYNKYMGGVHPQP